jgi:hypothetical protein
MANYWDRLHQVTIKRDGIEWRISYDPRSGDTYDRIIIDKVLRRIRRRGHKPRIVRLAFYGTTSTRANYFRCAVFYGRESFGYWRYRFNDRWHVVGKHTRVKRGEWKPVPDLIAYTSADTAIAINTWWSKPENAHKRYCPAYNGRLFLRREPDNSLSVYER